MSDGAPVGWESLPVVGADDILLSRRAAAAPGTVDPYLLRSALRQERTLDTIAALLTEIRDRLPDSSTLIASEAIVAPVAPPPPAPVSEPTRTGGKPSRRS